MESQMDKTMDMTQTMADVQGDNSPCYGPGFLV